MTAYTDFISLIISKMCRWILMKNLAQHLVAGMLAIITVFTLSSQ